VDPLDESVVGAAPSCPTGSFITLVDSSSDSGSSSDESLVLPTRATKRSRDSKSTAKRASQAEEEVDEGLGKEEEVGVDGRKQSDAGNIARRQNHQKPRSGALGALGSNHPEDSIQLSGSSSPSSPSSS